MFWKLLKIYLKNMYAPGAFFEGFKKGPKAIIKNILLILVAIYISVVFIAMFLSMAFGMYNTLEAVEKIQNMPSVAILISSCAILFFGFTSVATNYYSGAGDDQFFAMPLSIKDIFRAKFFMSFITDALFSGLIFAIFSIVYGLKLGLLVNPLFYIGLISVFLAFSSLILAVIYILLIGLLLLFPFLRKKSVLTGIASFLIIIFAASYGFLTGFSSATMDFSSTSTMTMPLALRLSAAVDKIPFIHFCGSALDGKVLPVLILLALSALVIFGLLPLFASLYAKTLAGFADVKSKRLSKEKAEAVIKESKINTAFKSLLIRDVRTVFREPSFFANGPLMVFLFPLILIVSTTVPVIVEGPEGGLGALVSAARSTYLQTSPEKLNNIFFYASIAISGIMYFSGTSSNVACTAFSREGKSLSNLKAMPVTFETILKVKFWHSMLYIFVDQIIFALLLTIANLIFGSLIPFSLLIRYFLAMCVLTIAASIPLIFTDLILDAANPKLNWENPAAAFKQNFNAVIGMLCSILMIGIMVGLGMLFPKSINSLIYISAIFIVIGAPLGALYFRYGVKRLINM